MALRSKQLLKELIIKHPDWAWEDLEGQAFVEIMQAFRSVPEEDQTSLVLSFTVVKEFIRRFLFLEELRRLSFSSKKSAYVSKLYNAGFTAGIKELQIRSKAKKTTIEKQYVEIANKLSIDIQTVSLIWRLVNGYSYTQKQLVEWARKQYPETKLTGHPKYYKWLSTFIEKLSTKDFALFYDKGETQVSLRKENYNTAKEATLALHTELIYSKKKVKKVPS